MLLLHTLSNGWCPFYLPWDLPKKRVSRHFRSSCSLALSPGCSPAQTLARQSLRQHWRVVGSLPRAAPAHTCPPLPPTSCPTIWSSWQLPAIFSPQTVPKLSLNLVSLHLLANWSTLLSVQNHLLNLCRSIHKVFWNAGQHMVYAFPLAICTTFAPCLRING